MFKRRSHQPQVSPLPHDPSHTQQQRYTSPASTPPQHNMNGTLAGPAYSDGRGMERASSAGTTGSSVGAGDKGEKRKSGFFSLGRKGHKDKPERESFDRPRPNSFSVERGPHPSSPLAQPNGQQQQQQNGQFQPYHMRQFPPPHKGHTPPPPDQPGLRNASNPLPLTPTNDFGSAPNGQPQGLPKSQSMGPQGFRVPDTHPYRGFLTAQQQQQQQQQQQGSLPRSASSPLAPPQPQSMSGHSGHSSATDVTDTPTASASAPAPAPPPSTAGGSVDQPRIVSRKEDIPQTPREKQRVASATAATAGGVPLGLNGSPGGPASTWMREFEGIVDLIGGQPGKTYVASPPELEMILARTSAGGQPKQGPPGSQNNDWDAVWLQLSGISLSMWSMKETRAAAARGEKVPPTYFNITDSSLELLAALPPPPHRPTSHPHPHVFSLNTAGSNRLLFSCPSERDLARWSTGLRLAAWERSKLEEIYTGHLIKSGGREPASELQRGRMEGWVRVRVMGGTDWKRLWLVLSKPYVETAEEEKKNRRRSFFGLGDKAEKEVVQEPNTGEAMASFYPEPRTQKNRTTSVAVLTITNVTQAYAVFPERLEVMSQSNLMKVVGRVHGEMVTIEGRLRDSGWALIMPELSADSPADPPATSPLSHMMKWVTGVHDIFSLYGRPERYIWDRQNPDSLFFAYPQGEDRARLFLDIEDATQADFRLTNLAQIRKSFASLTVRKLQGTLNPYAPDDDDKPTPRPEGNYRLPPLPFTQQQQQQISPQLSQDNHTQPRSLTPITEQTDIASRQNSTKTQGTTRSQPLASSSDRRYSSEAPSKQGSGSSKFLSPGAGEERLAPIQDTTEFVTTEEPEPQSASEPPNSASLTSESQSGPTVWSQDSAGPTPTNTFGSHLPAPPQPLTAMPEPTPATSSGGVTEKPSIDSLRNHDLPELPPTSPITLPDPRQSLGPIVSQPPQVLSPTPRRVSSSGELNQVTGTNGLRDEPAAMYLMNMVEEPASSIPPDNARPRSASPKKPLSIVTNFDRSKPNEPLGRKPSGARALPPKKGGSGGSGGSVGPGRDLDVIQDAPSPASPSRSPQPQPPAQPANDGPVPAAVPGNAPGSAPAPPNATAHTLQASASERARKPSNDLDEDAAVFAAYADQPSPAKKAMPPVPPAQNGAAPPARSAAAQEEVRSSFAPSKAAAERRAKAEQAAADQQRAMTMPGGGKRVGQTTGRANANDEWSEDEDESDEDASPVAPMQSQLPPPAQPSHAPQAPSSFANQFDGGSIGRSTSKARALPPVPTPIAPTGGDFFHQPRSPVQSTAAHVHALPPAPPQDRPRSRSPQAPQQRQSSYHPQPQQHPLPPMPPPQSLPPQQQPPATRQSVWNANFSQEHGHAQPSGKFVELEEPSVQLTKAFSPHGLLQAGMQDKEERSAKKQEELARETGSSLISVPSKPPPPSAGLLGAVAAHERDRKNAGGIGATLTDREREKRLNEERQREQQSRMYGDGSPPPGMYPGMMGIGMGMPGMNMGMGMPGMPGYPMGFGQYNPYAQQQAMMAAQMAYQQAMMQSYHQQHPLPQSPPPQQPGQPPSPAPPPPARPASSQGGDGLDRPSSAGSFQAQQGQYFNPHMSMYGGWGGGMPMVNPWMMPMPGMGSPGMMQPNGYDWQPQPGQDEARSVRGDRHEAN